MLNILLELDAAIQRHIFNGLFDWFERLSRRNRLRLLGSSFIAGYTCFYAASCISFHDDPSSRILVSVTLIIAILATPFLLANWRQIRRLPGLELFIRQGRALNAVVLPIGLIVIYLGWPIFILSAFGYALTLPALYMLTNL